MNVSFSDRLVVISFALARTLLCAYRAYTQSFTVDEAFSFNHYLTGPWARIFQDYDPNNHLLYSMLAKLSMRIFGLSEFTLRLPSVIAGFFLVAGIYYVLAELVSSKWIRWMALISLSIYPLLLDLSIAARGYSIALACLIWAMYHMLRGNHIAAGILLGCGIAANLTNAFPSIALMAAALLLAKGNFEQRLRPPLELAIPSAAIVAVICYPALSKATTSQFYLGEPTIARSLLNIVFTSIRGTVDRSGLFGTLTGTHIVEYVVLPVLLLFLAVTAPRLPRPMLLPVIALGVSLAELVTVHYLFDLNYPVDRTGVYLVLLLVFSWAPAVDRTPAVAVRAVSAVLAAAIALQFVTQFQMRYFSIWPADLPMKQVAQALRDETLGRPPESVSISATWYHQPALEFYRYYYAMAALKPVERRDQTALSGFDYYVLNLKDDDAVHAGNPDRLTPLLHEPLSGVLLAREPALAR
jgi:hypothetical protein